MTRPSYAFFSGQLLLPRAKARSGDATRTRSVFQHDPSRNSLGSQRQQPFGVGREDILTTRPTGDTTLVIGTSHTPEVVAPRGTEEEEDETPLHNARTTGPTVFRTVRRETDLPTRVAEFPPGPRDHPRRKETDPPGERLQHFAREWEWAPLPCSE